MSIPPAAKAALPAALPTKGLWSLAAADPASTEYLMPFVLRLTGDIDLAALRGALTDVVARHTSLRTVFEAVDGTPTGRVLDDPAGLGIDAVRPIRDDIKARVRVLLNSLGVEPSA